MGRAVCVSSANCMVSCSFLQSVLWPISANKAASPPLCTVNQASHLQPNPTEFISDAYSSQTSLNVSTFGGYMRKAGELVGLDEKYIKNSLSYPELQGLALKPEALVGGNRTKKLDKLFRFSNKVSDWSHFKWADVPIHPVYIKIIWSQLAIFISHMPRSCPAFIKITPFTETCYANGEGEGSFMQQLFYRDDVHRGIFCVLMLMVKQPI